MQLELFPPPSISLEEVFEAYFSCRKNKRKTANAASFEVDYESNLMELHQEINNGTYHPGPSLAFMVNKPVLREIFAADFRDRVVHHLIINKMEPLFEKQFIHDSYACRKGRGTHFGIARVDQFIRRCSANFSREAWALKLDIRGFFMSIDREHLYSGLSHFLSSRYHLQDLNLLLDLCKKTIYADPAADCTIRGTLSDWNNLPRDKSLFFAAPGCGLPIGNLTSQHFANFYLDELDHFIKHDLGIAYYGRYVDDMVFVHQDRKVLCNLIYEVRKFLEQRLGLCLHPGKIYLQPVRHGVPFLGAIIKPGRIYVARRTISSCYRKIDYFNCLVEDHKPSTAEKDAFQSSINSYLGILGHYRTARLRKAIWEKVSPRWKVWFSPA